MLSLMMLCLWLRVMQDVRSLQMISQITVSPESRFTPNLWAEHPSDARLTTNGPESFHSHYNQQFYSPQPSIHVFLDVIIAM